jgi:hypothetical protein
VARVARRAVATPAVLGATRKHRVGSGSPARALLRNPGVGRSVAAAAFAPPTVSDTKAKFMTGYTKPIPAIYSTVLQELLVQQHFIRYSKNYVYNPVGPPATRSSRTATNVAP